MDWRLDPTRELELQRSRQKANQQQLQRLAEEGQIAAEGIRSHGEALGKTITNAVDQYYAGKHQSEESQAHQMRMQLANQELARQKAEQDYLDSPILSEEENAAIQADPSLKEKIMALPHKTRREQSMDLRSKKTEAEIQELLSRHNKTKDTGMTEYQKAQLEIQRQRLANERQKNADKPEKGSAGEEQLDKDFAKSLNEWDSTGKGSFSKNISKLRGAKAKLEEMAANKKDWRGWAGRSYGRLPDDIKDQDAVVTREDVRAAAQGALKATLGSQFTEREGEAIMRRSYDENLSPEENLARINLMIDELENNAVSMEERGKFFRKNKGSLRGYEPGAFQIADQQAPPKTAKGGDGTAMAAPSGGKQEVKREHSKSRKVTRVTYSDGSVEVIPDAK